jgi:GTP-binding protein Era
MGKVPAGQMRCGLVALVGAPNVGKSSLMNALVGESVGIVSPKPNTTRMSVRGVAVHGNAQVVFVDTPGLNSSKGALDRALVQQAQGSAAEADVVALVIDGAKGFDDRAKDLLAKVGKGVPVVLIINKVDKLKPRSKVLALMTEAQEIGRFSTVFAVSATGGGGMKDVVPGIAALVPEGPWLFPPGQVTDVPLPVRLAEITRAVAMRFLHEEVPYSVAVLPHDIDDSGKPWVVQQLVVVGRAAHKPIVLGAGGSMLKRIGTAARQEMQEIVGMGIRLELEVEVREGWTDKLQMLTALGMDDA